MTEWSRYGFVKSPSFHSILNSVLQSPTEEPLGTKFTYQSILVNLSFMDTQTNHLRMDVALWCYKWIGLGLGWKSPGEVRVEQLNL